MMYTISNHGKETVLNLNENSTWNDYGKEVMKVITSNIENTTTFTILKRDDGEKEIFNGLTYVNKGDSFFVTDSYPVPQKYRNDFKKCPNVERYLDCIDPFKNSNKSYRMVNNGDGTFSAYYGRINDPNSRFGQHLYSKPHIYPDYMFEIKYEEKILKGYKDVTEFLCSGEAPTNEKISLGIKDKVVCGLVQKLIDCSRKAIEMNYETPSFMISEKAIKKARSEIKKMSSIKSRTTAFNKHLVELFHIIPRKIDNVSEMLAMSKNDFAEIVQRETDLLDVLEHKISFDKKSSSDGTLAQMDIEIYQATPDQKKQVMSKIDFSKQKYVKNIYRVINHKTQKNFDKFLKERKIRNVKQLWHGSRNENWLSIIDEGLILNPDAVITGKMFGQGLYFAPSISKSWGYTSMHNSVWANGTSETCYIGLYATAYGNPLEVSSYSSDYACYSESSLNGKYDCLHAKKGEMLRADEIVFYNESATTINYLVEFEERSI